MYGDASVMGGSAIGGNDTLNAHDSTTTILYGDAYSLSGKSRGGDDVLVGSEWFFSVNFLNGDGYELTDCTIAGNDTLISGTGPQITCGGDAASLSKQAKGGSDTFVSRRTAEMTPYLISTILITILST